MVDPHVLAPQGVQGHLDAGKYEQDPAIDYVEVLALSVVRGTMGDAIYGGKECENLQSCLRLCELRAR